MDKLIVIPALNPGDGLIAYIDRLKDHGFDHILIVDDGSRKSCRRIFDEAENKGCMILRHDVNLGKGRALKDAMAFYLDSYAGDTETTPPSPCLNFAGIITADSDGQHTAEDVAKVAKAMDEHPDSLILGSRDFDTGNVPPKSKFGNKCTITALKLFIGGNVSDTQTGLRGIPNSLIGRYSALKGERFEYETVMLVDAIHEGTDIVEVPIRTVYIDNNTETHFNPIKDSAKIYAVILGTFFRYTLSSLSSFLVDYGIFCAMIFMLGVSKDSAGRSVWIATVVARICSSIFNYTINKKVVFKSDRGHATIIMYYILCVCQMAASAAFVSLIGSTGFPVQIAKIIVDSILFLISFRIQKTLIFTRH
ncbi:MAG: bifunctional glycosyltransferase family 2/GtrA family protein [Lachnospiraceae bacterium]|nr:bifunctional glycosyltransferase family 2/GtrA family protein [Lachnospiraceae bacterium]